MMSSDCEWPLFMTSMAVGLSEHMNHHIIS